MEEPLIKPAPVWLRVLRKMRGHFILGIFVSVPLMITFLILEWAFNTVDNILQPIFIQFFHFHIPGLGFAATVVLIYILGTIASNVFGRRMIKWGESLLGRLPIVRHLYGGIKQVTDSFGKTNKSTFSRVVIVEFPGPGLKAIGFVTNESTSVSGEKMLNVFVPTAPNPTTGFLEIIPENKVIPTNIPVDEAIKLVVSVGRLSGSNLAEIVESQKQTT